MKNWRWSIVSWTRLTSKSFQRYSLERSDSTYEWAYIPNKVGNKSQLSVWSYKYMECTLYSSCAVCALWNNVTEYALVQFKQKLKCLTSLMNKLDHKREVRPKPRNRGQKSKILSIWKAIFYLKFDEPASINWCLFKYCPSDDAFNQMRHRQFSIDYP